MKGAFFRGIGNVKSEVIDRTLAVLAEHKLVCCIGNANSMSSVRLANRAQSQANILIDCGAVVDEIVFRELAD
jgi:hypothetical protein